MAGDLEGIWHLCLIQLVLEQVRIGRNEMSDLLKKNRGSGPGCILSPCIFIPIIVIIRAVSKGLSCGQCGI